MGNAVMFTEFFLFRRFANPGSRSLPFAEATLRLEGQLNVIQQTVKI